MGRLEELCAAASRRYRNRRLVLELGGATFTAVMWVSALAAFLKSMPLALGLGSFGLVGWIGFRVWQHHSRMQILNAVVKVMERDPQLVHSSFLAVRTSYDRTHFDPAKRLPAARTYAIEFSAAHLPSCVIPGLKGDDVRAAYAELRGHGAQLPERHAEITSYRETRREADHYGLYQRLFLMRKHAERKNLFLGLAILGITVPLWISGSDPIVKITITFLLVLACTVLIESWFNTAPVRRFVDAIANGTEINAMRIDHVSFGHRERDVQLAAAEDLPQSGQLEVVVSYRDGERFTFRGEPADVSDVLRRLPASGPSTKAT